MSEQVTIPGTHAPTHVLRHWSGKPIGLDWGKIDALFQLNCAPEHRRGAPKPQVRVRTAAASGSAYQGGTRAQGPITTAEVDKMVRLYRDEKQKVADIAPLIPCTQRTVRSWLEKRGVYDPSRDRGKRAS